MPDSHARDLIEWNGVLPNVRVVEEANHGATPTFMVVADYGWAEHILCGGCYLQAAEAICAAIQEAAASTTASRRRPIRRAKRRLLRWRNHFRALANYSRGYAWSCIKRGRETGKTQ